MRQRERNDAPRRRHVRATSRPRASRDQQRQREHDATRANVGEHGAFRLAENGWFLLCDWRICGRGDSGVFARKGLFFDGK
jgi:hypothetical protein